jgi:hypothetical protein
MKPVCCFAPGATPFDAPDFAIIGSDSIASALHDLTGNLAFVATALVSVFPVVAASPSAIMFASVTERPRDRSAPR